MNRTLKNIIMSVVLIITIILTGITIHCASNNEIPEKNNNREAITSNEDREEKEPTEEQPQEPKEEDSSQEEPETSESPDLNAPVRKSKTKYFVLFTIEGLVIGLTGSYLVISGFNKKTFKETFEDKDKIVICILSTIILTGAVITTGALVSKCGHSNDIKEIREQHVRNNDFDRKNNPNRNREINRNRPNNRVPNANDKQQDNTKEETTKDSNIKEA